MDRLVIVPDEAFEPLTASLKLRLSGIIREVDSRNLQQFMGEESMRYLTSLTAASPQDGGMLLWARDGKGYGVAWASDPSLSQLLGRVRADGQEGLIARIFANGRAVSESSDDLQAPEWTNLESLCGMRISEMAGSPVFLFDSCTAVLTRVRYAGDFLESAEGDLKVPSEGAVIFARLIEDRVLRATLGLESS